MVADKRFDAGEAAVVADSAGPGESPLSSSPYRATDPGPGEANARIWLLLSYSATVIAE